MPNSFNGQQRHERAEQRVEAALKARGITAHAYVNPRNRDQQQAEADALLAAARAGEDDDDDQDEDDDWIDDLGGGLHGNFASSENLDPAALLHRYRDVSRHRSAFGLDGKRL